MKKNILGIMGIVGLLFAGCSSEDDILSSFHNDPNAVHITAEVGKASADGFTRSNPLGATEADQKKFNTDDEISVKADGQDAVTYKFNGSEWIPQDEKFLKWESETMNFTAYYPASYTGGTPTQPTEYTSEASLAAADYMSFSNSVNKPTDNNTLTLTMERQMARVVVDIAGFNDQYAGATVNNIKSVSIKGVKAYKHSDKKFYALMVPCDAQSTENFLSLEVGEGNTETLTGIPVLEAGKSYTYQITVGKNKVVVTGITVKDWTTGETFEGKATPTPYVTFTAEGEQTFKLVKNGYFPSNIEYSVNEGEWNILKETDEILFGGDKGKLQLRGTNNLNGTSADNNYSTINFTDASVKVACTGDIRTLLDYKTYKTVETKEARFCKLFSGCTELTSAPDLPATTLAESCYYYMFRGCTNLDTAPALPAETLANSCYDSMFLGCTNLKTAPALPAETLVDYCYYYMFNGCKNLKTAPVLPATALANSCYYNMFSGCTNLKTAPKLPATTLANSCYSCMFKDCKNLNTAPELQATTLASYCYYRMFGGCTNLKTAPELPATTLASLCYANMFNGCTNLTSVTMLAPSDQISKTTYCCRDWLNGAGTNATSRTLKVKDADAYKALQTKGYLPANWKKGAEGTTVLGENSNKIE
nr:fimbrillin family protein [uncultured Prevotella sp.]